MTGIIQVMFVVVFIVFVFVPFIFVFMIGIMSNVIDWRKSKLSRFFAGYYVPVISLVYTVMMLWKYIYLDPVINGISLWKEPIFLGMILAQMLFLVCNLYFAYTIYRRAK